MAVSVVKVRLSPRIIKLCIRKKKAHPPSWHIQYNAFLFIYGFKFQVLNPRFRFYRKFCSQSLSNHREKEYRTERHRDLFINRRVREAFLIALFRFELCLPTANCKLLTVGWDQTFPNQAFLIFNCFSVAFSAGLM